MKNSVNESISEFIKNNKDTRLVRQLMQANEQRDREAFAHLLAAVREAMQMQTKIDGYEAEIIQMRHYLKGLKRDKGRRQVQARSST